MAESKLTNFSNALSQKFAPKIAKQFNRMCVGLASVETVPPSEGLGAKNVAWDVNLGGATAFSYLEGADIQSSDYSIDTAQPATLSWAEYSSAFWVSGTLVDAAFMSGGSATALINFIEDQFINNSAAVASLANQDFYYGTGDNGSGVPNVVGLLGGALEESGSYANIDRGTYPLWKGHALSNGGVMRPLTPDLIRQGDQAVFISTNEMPTKYLCSTGVYRKYQDMFDPLVRVAAGRGDLTYNMGTNQIFWRGVPIIQDKDIDESVAGGVIIGLNDREVKKVYLPHKGVPMDVPQVLEDGKGVAMDQSMSTGLQFRLIPLFKSGDSYKFQVLVKFQLQVRHPNSCFYINNLAV